MLTYNTNSNTGPVCGGRAILNNKPRVLITISLQFPVRILVRSGFIEWMTNYAQPVIALGWDDDELQLELEGMGAEVHILPQVEYSSVHKHMKRKIDYIWNRNYLKSLSLSLDNKILDALYPKSIYRRIQRKLMRMYWIIQFSILKKYDQLIKEEKKAFADNPASMEIEKLLLGLNIEAVLTQTPYNHHDEVLLRLAKKNKIPICAAVLSFDNPTAYGRIPVICNCYLLWNKYNRKEILRGYPEASSSVIKIIGPPQFDFYYDKSYTWDEKTWREKLNLPVERPIILFGAGYFKIVPNEHLWLKQIDDAIENGEIKNNPIILFRIHPVDPIDRWKPILKDAKNIVFDEPWKTPVSGKGRVNIQKVDIEKLVSILYHTQVHINASSTMTIDGAIFDKPQIGPAYDDQPGGKYNRIVKDLYKREHFIPIVNSGGLELANSREELISLVNSAFNYPGRLSSERQKMVKEICTYNDGRSTDRLEDAFKSFLEVNGLL